MSRHRHHSSGRSAFAAGGVAVLLVAVLAVGYLGVLRAEGGAQPANASITTIDFDPRPAMPSTQIQGRPTLLVISDSYAAGNGDTSYETYAPRVAATMGWNLRLDAIGGSGYIESMIDGTRVGRPFSERLPGDIGDYRPDYVLIDGGRNDFDKPMDLVVKAIGELFDDVRAAWPDASIIVMKPQQINPMVHPQYGLIGEVIDVSAARIGALTIDPVAQGWYTDIDVEALTIDDRIHPNDAGSQFYADRVVAALQALGIHPATPQAGEDAP
jgi:lysophospholipase L1-like esterase